MNAKKNLLILINVASYVPFFFFLTTSISTRRRRTMMTRRKAAATADTMEVVREEVIKHVFVEN